MKTSTPGSPSHAGHADLEEGTEPSCKTPIHNIHRAHSDPIPLKFSHLVDDTDKDFVIFEDFDVEESETLHICTKSRYKRENENQFDATQHNLRYRSENKEVCLYFHETHSGESCNDPAYTHKINTKYVSEDPEKAVDGLLCDVASFRGSKSGVLIESPPPLKSNLNAEIPDLSTLQKMEFKIYCDTPQEQSLKARKFTQGTSDTRVPLTPLPCIRGSDFHTRDDIGLSSKLTPNLQDSRELSVHRSILLGEELSRSTPINNVNLLGNASSRFVNAIYMEKPLMSPYVNNRYHNRDQIRLKLSFQSTPVLDGFESLELFNLSNITSLTYSSDSSPGNEITIALRENEYGSCRSFFSSKKLFRAKFRSLQVRKATKSVQIAPFRSLRTMNSSEDSVSLTFHNSLNLLPRPPQHSLNSSGDTPCLMEKKNISFDDKVIVLCKNAKTKNLKISAEIGFPQEDNAFQEKASYQVPILLTIEDVYCEERFPEYTHDICLILGVQHSCLRSSKQNINEKFFAQIVKRLSKNDRITVLYMDDEEFLVKMCQASNEVKDLIKNIIGVKRTKSNLAFNIFTAIKKVVDILWQRRYHSNFTSICVITDFSVQNNMTNQELHTDIKDLFLYIQEAGLLNDETFSIYGMGYGNQDFNVLSEICYLSKGDFYHVIDYTKYNRTLRLLNQRMFHQKLFQGEITIAKCFDCDLTLHAPGYLITATDSKNQWTLLVPKLFKGGKKNFMVFVKFGDSQTEYDLINQTILEVQFKAKMYERPITMQNRRSNIMEYSTSKLCIQLPSTQENIDLKESYNIHLHCLRLLLVQIIEEFAFSYLNDDFKMLESILRANSNLYRLIDLLQNNALKLNIYERIFLGFMEHIVTTIIRINRSNRYSNIYSNYLSIISNTLLYEAPSVYSDLFQQTMEY